MNKNMVWECLNDSSEVRKLLEVDESLTDNEFVSANDLKISTSKPTLIHGTLFKENESRVIDRFNNAEGIQKLLHNKYTARIILNFDFYFVREFNTRQFISQLKYNRNTFFSNKILNAISNRLEYYNLQAKKCDDTCKAYVNFLSRFLDLNEGISSEGVNIYVSFWATDSEINNIEKQTTIHNLQLQGFEIIEDVMV